MRRITLLILAAAAFGAAQTKVEAERQLASTAASPAGRVLAWLPTGPVRVANLDPDQFELVVATPTPVLRLKQPPVQSAPVREKAVRLLFGGGPMSLPDAPLAGTVVKVFRNGVFQDPTGNGDYTLSGTVITPNAAAGWATNDLIVAVYLY